MLIKPCSLKATRVIALTSVCVPRRPRGTFTAQAVVSTCIVALVVSTVRSHNNKQCAANNERADGFSCPQRTTQHAFLNLDDHDSIVSVAPHKRRL